MGKFGIGQPVRRTEDARLLTGRAVYTDDLILPGQAYAYVVRSPHAHARLASIDAAEALETPGVLAVLTGADLEADGLGGLPCVIPLKNRDGSPLVTPPRPALAVGRVRHVGDPVALVVAESLDQARSAAERVYVSYEEVPPVTDPTAAVRPDAPLVWDEAPGNLCFDWDKGDEAAVAAAFDRASRVVSLDLVNNRVIPNPMETRAAIGAYDRGSERYTLYTPTQGGHVLQRMLSHHVLKVPESRIRVVTPEVGGGFGLKLFLFPEQVLVLWASRRLGRPVKWTCERSEGLAADNHGRDHVSHAEMALDDAGRILALRVSTIVNLGAYLSNYSPFVATSAGVNMLAGVYTIPAVYVNVRGVFTNTAPVDAYRGAGRPEANFVVERMIDHAARELGMSPAELRRRNFIPPQAMPYRTAMDLVYDSGEFERLMERALAAADAAGFESRRAEARERGLLRGLGVASYVEACGGGNEERAEIRVDQTGAATVLIGTQNNGQGHETAYAQIVADRLGLRFEDVRLIQNDTDAVGYGKGTAGSRSIPVGGSAVVRAAEKIVAKARRIAAHMLEAAEADIEMSDGVFTVVGTDRRVTMHEVAAAAYDTFNLPKGIEPGLDETAFYIPETQTFPNGCHVCEVEIDPETGVVRIVRYTVVDDFGKIINPMLLTGQVHGGIAQGLGQALLEHVVYDPDSGQLLSGSFMDYCMPRADDLPSIALETVEVPCTTNPLGVKGAGEAGAIGAPPAAINAIVDALAEFGIRHVDMPATSEKIWHLIRDARAA